MPIASCKQKLATLAPSRVSLLIHCFGFLLINAKSALMNIVLCKSWNSFKLTQHLKNTVLMCRMLQKTRDASATVIHIHLLRLRTPKMEWKNVFCVNATKHWLSSMKEFFVLTPQSGGSGDQQSFFYFFLYIVSLPPYTILSDSLAKNKKIHYNSTIIVS